MKIAYIRPSNAKGYLRVGIGSESCSSVFTVAERDYAELGSPNVGEELSDDVIFALELSDERYRARAKALRVLSYGDNSEGMLLRKLHMVGISRDVALEVVCEMVSRGYINSRRQLEKLVANEVNLKNAGPMKLIPKLISKGYKKSEIVEVVEDLASRGEIDFDAAKERLLRGAPEDEVRKILYKNGYTVC